MSATGLVERLLSACRCLPPQPLRLSGHSRPMANPVFDARNRMALLCASPRHVLVPKQRKPYLIYMPAGQTSLPTRHGDCKTTCQAKATGPKLAPGGLTQPSMLKIRREDGKCLLHLILDSTTALRRIRVSLISACASLMTSTGFLERSMARGCGGGCGGGW